MSKSVPDLEIPAEDDQRRMIAALGYLFTPIVPLLNLANAENTDKWLRVQSMQALVWAVPFVVLLVASIVLLLVLVAFNFLFICLLPLVIVLPFLPGAIWARRVYLGDEVRIRYISNRISV